MLELSLPPYHGKGDGRNWKMYRGRAYLGEIEESYHCSGPFDLAGAYIKGEDTCYRDLRKACKVLEHRLYPPWYIALWRRLKGLTS